MRKKLFMNIRIHSGSYAGGGAKRRFIKRQTHTATGLTLCMNSNNTSQPILRIRLKVVNLFYKATCPAGPALPGLLSSAASTPVPACQDCSPSQED